MKIGIDVDNCLANFNDTWLNEYLQHDRGLGNRGIVNPAAEHFRRGMFAWTAAEEENFYRTNGERVAQKLQPLADAPAVVRQLKADGHEIYVITGRDNGEYRDPRALTERWLKQHHIVYDHLILTNAYDPHAKTAVCLANHITLMIEDSTSASQDLRAHGVKVLTMNTRFNQKDQTLTRVTTWAEIYDRITALNRTAPRPRLNVILDTDTNNECDDQFALAYLLRSQEQLTVDAITIAPYHHDNHLSIAEGTERSYQEVLKICDWLHFATTDKVFKGATNYLATGADTTNAAVNRIIEVAQQNDKTYLLAIGALTNVALAIKREPKIVNKIEVIWLGGHSFLSPDNREFNFRQDVAAVRTVFASAVKLTLIPCKNVASNLRTSIYEVAHFLKGKSALGDYLCQRFYDDGVHGRQERRVIWDISAVAYLLNRDWFETAVVACPQINDDTSYAFNPTDRQITVVNYLQPDAIFRDLFAKLGRSGS